MYKTINNIILEIISVNSKIDVRQFERKELYYGGLV